MMSEQRKVLGQFLKSRRERLSPDLSSYPTRRRTPGLRREEVAELAGISTAWYTYIEQGRDVQPSREVLEALSVALRLDTAERNHLFNLALSPVPEPPSDFVPDSLRNLLSHLHVYPAYAVGHTWNLVAWNKAACRLFTDFALLEPEARNLVLYVFTNAALKQRYVDWECHARRMLAQFRASMAAYPNEPAFAALVKNLADKSPEFSQWWQEQDVKAPASGVKEFIHPKVGVLKLEYSTLQVNENPNLMLVTYLPINESGLQQLAELTNL